MKTREWWICCNVGGEANELALSDTAARSLKAIKLGRYPTDEVVHVIEKSAYDRLSAMCERLAEALDFYSKFTSYNETEIDGEPRIPVYWEDMSGRRARLALIEYRAMRAETKMPCPRNE